VTPEQRHRAVVYAETLHAEIAEYRLAHEGIKPQLLAYLHGIWRAYGHV
jgi:hypothetical protein